MGTRSFRCSFNDEDDDRFEIIEAPDAEQAAEIFAALMYKRHSRMRQYPDWDGDDSIQVIEVGGSGEPEIFNIEVVKQPAFLASPAIRKTL